MHHTFVNKRAQRGISLTGLIVVLALLGVVAVFAMKTIPAYAEYSAVKDAIKTAKEAGGTVGEMQLAFNKNAEVSNVEAVTGRDLVISKESGETQISFAYEKRIPLVANISLLIDFAGTTDPSGVVAAQPANE